MDDETREQVALHHGASTPTLQPGQHSRPATRSASTASGSFSTMSTGASGIAQKDPLVYLLKE